MREVTNPNDWSVLFVCVVGKVFDSTSLVLSGAELARRQGATAGMPKKRNRVPISGGSDCGDTICADVCRQSNIVQAVSSWTSSEQSSSF